MLALPMFLSAHGLILIFYVSMKSQCLCKSFELYLLTELKFYKAHNSWDITETVFTCNEICHHTPHCQVCYKDFFSVRLLSVLRGHSVFSSPSQRPMTSDFLSRFFPLHLFSYLNSWERASIFPFECSVLNKGTTGTIFITSLWRSPWRGIEPRTSRTQGQHYTTKLSRRRCYKDIKHVLFNFLCFA